jgi:hypothetical protein
MFAGLGRDRAELLVGAVNVVALSLVGACAAACAMEWVLWGKPDQVRRTAPAPDTSIHGYAVTNTSARLARALDDQQSSAIALGSLLLLGRAALASTWVALLLRATGDTARTVPYRVRLLSAWALRHAA